MKHGLLMDIVWHSRKNENNKFKWIVVYFRNRIYIRTHLARNSQFKSFRIANDSICTNQCLILFTFLQFYSDVSLWQHYPCRFPRAVAFLVASANANWMLSKIEFKATRQVMSSLSWIYYIFSCYFFLHPFTSKTPKMANMLLLAANLLNFVEFISWNATIRTLYFAFSFKCGVGNRSKKADW